MKREVLTSGARTRRHSSSPLSLTLLFFWPAQPLRCRRRRRRRLGRAPRAARRERETKDSRRSASRSLHIFDSLGHQQHRHHHAPQTTTTTTTTPRSDDDHHHHSRSKSKEGSFLLSYRSGRALVLWVGRELPWCESARARFCSALLCGHRRRGRGARERKQEGGRGGASRLSSRRARAPCGLDFDPERIRYHSAPSASSRRWMRARRRAWAHAFVVRGRGFGGGGSRLAPRGACPPPCSLHPPFRSLALARGAELELDDPPEAVGPPGRRSKLATGTAEAPPPPPRRDDERKRGVSSFSRRGHHPVFTHLLPSLDHHHRDTTQQNP
jgi:hypothetical protein